MNLSLASNNHYKRDFGIPDLIQPSFKKIFFMKPMYFFIVALLLSFSAVVHAQSPCDAVSVEVIAPQWQTGYYSYFGVRVSLPQPYYQNVTVSGYIFDSPDHETTDHPYTLTIPAGSLSAETSTDFYQTGPAAEGAANITSVSVCPGDGDAFTMTPVSDPSVTSILSNAFDSLNVDMTKLSTALGLSSTLRKSDINFTNLQLSYANDSDTARAISASFNSNSGSNSVNYSFTVFTDGTNYYNPTIVKSTASDLVYFDLTEGKVTTISNCTSSNFTVSQSTSDYIRSDFGVPCNGQQVMDCVTNVLTQHGWGSVILSTVSLFRPVVGAAVVAACIRYHCIHLVHGPGYL
ncbi:MAG TPA: hypothetical protein VI413_08045 [Paludibacter sp.]|jgi:hypothetical protein